MGSLCGIVRSGESLMAAREALSPSFEPVSNATLAMNELRNLHTRGAAHRTLRACSRESRGALPRGLPTPRAEFQKHSLVSRAMEVTFAKPVAHHSWCRVATHLDACVWRT